MQLVRTHQVLGFLADLPLDGGQQLRGHRGIQNILQHIVELLVLFRVVPGKIPYQVAHQRLGDRAVDAVHAHVVTVVGAPAQSQLGKVAGADDQAAGLVGDIHKHLSPFPGLAVLKGNGVVLHVVADILEVAADGSGDIHGFEGSAHTLRQDDRVVLRAVRGAEAGHGDGHDVRHGPVQHLHGKSRDQHRQSGVQATGEAHHRGLGPGVLQPLFETKGRNQQNLPAPGIPILFTLGNEGLGSNIPGQLGLGQSEGEGNLPYRRSLVEHLGPAALIAQLLHIHLGHQQTTVEPPLRQHGAVFGDHLVSAENHIRGGLTLAGAGIDIAAQQLGALHGHQLAAVAVLADDVVASRQIADDSSPGRRQVHGGGAGSPHILADLKAQSQVRHICTAEHQLVAEGHGLSQKGHRPVLLRCSSKLPLLVKFAVIGQVSLGNHTQNSSFLYNHRTIIQFVIYPQRHTYGSDDLQVPGSGQNGGQCLLRGPQQGVLIEQVTAGVPGQAQLRQHQHLGASLFGLAHQGKGLLRVVVAIRQTQLGRAAGDRDKTIFHVKKPPRSSMVVQRYFTPHRFLLQAVPPKTAAQLQAQKGPPMAVLFAVCV